MTSEPHRAAADADVSRADSPDAIAIGAAAGTFALAVAALPAVRRRTPAWVLLGFAAPIATLVAVVTTLARRLRLQTQVHQVNVANDEPTSLPNRRRFYEIIEQWIDASTTTPFALVLIDLDRFRAVNDTLGHDVGDKLLRVVAQRLSHSVRDSDVVTRLGGDEFAILLKDVANDEDALNATRKIRRELESPFALDGLKIDIAGSMGITLCPAHGDDATTLLQKADVAMYQAKGTQSRVVVYDRSADANTPERLGMIAELRHAIDHDELVLHYQPKAQLEDGTIEGVEALVRWQHPTRGTIPPGLFIPLAEETGLIKPITDWVVDTALRQARAWREQGIALVISVNLSARNLHDPALGSHIAEMMRKWSAAGDWMCLEITESAVMEDPEAAIEGLNGLADMGLELSMDDYGTGYSALNYLKHLPLSEIKIDRSFVANVITDQTDALIISSTIELGHQLGLRVVAEGVETEDDWEGLQLLGCDVAQGYFLGRPMPPHELADWLTQSGRPYVRCEPVSADAAG